MKVELSNFQPLALFNQHAKGAQQSDADVKDNRTTHIDKKNVATNIINDRLNSALGIPNETEKNNENNFDFESVSNNILGFVTDAITKAKNNGATESELQQMFSDAQKGIKEGLGDASKELKGLGLLSNDVKNGIKETEGLLKEGLKKLNDDLFSENEDSPMLAGNYREGSHYSLSKDASYSITTKEGDEIKITFNSDYKQQSASVMNMKNGIGSFATSNKSEFQAAFTIEINGELNDDEQQAVNELMGNLQNVSDLFFSGNLDDAFEKAKTISMDPTHLAAFSMDLQRTETVASIKEYQQVMPGKEIAQQFLPVNDELTKAYEHAKPFAIEEHLTDLLGWLMPEQDSSDLQKYSQSIIEQLQNLDNITA
ncbi:hypothetical protein CW745_14140 [Psychromonas sp. psych-6C06]|uniref:DUF5610 domain-containing protein n=1 Tax=Psychromonas sp. psych-6C06 TaxID=2058089 RepID=UPI000C3495D2|nr:DUF5610 domain-containing protein [Psychromonas sp. psych-6C06]PKF60664.1 hypothetical protein CW745_14140 [Psychromonas sp. psych-6C06]